MARPIHTFRARCAPYVAWGLALLVPTLAAAGTEASWTRWGGPTQDFRAPAAGISEKWPAAGPARLWTRDLGDGYSTVLVEDGRLYTMYRAGEEEAVVSLDAETGKTLWERRYDHDPHADHVTQFGTGPRATPLISGDRIYAIGVAGRMHCLNKKDGEVLWSHDLWGDEFGGNLLPHGYASSPIEYGDTIIVLVGAEPVADGEAETDGDAVGNGRSIVAFDKTDGSIVWQSLDFGNSYSTPQILEVDGQDQLVTFMAKELIGVDPKNGNLLWRYAHENPFEQNITPPALVDGQYLFLSTLQTGARGLKLTHVSDTETSVEELWSTRKVQFYHATCIRDGDWVYGSSGGRSPAFMAGINIKTGEIAWRKRGFAKANSVYADGKVIVLDEDGTLYLTTATPDDLVVHSQTELLDRVAWTAPTIVGKTLYVRDKAKIMAVDLSTEASAEVVAEASADEPAVVAAAAEAAAEPEPAVEPETLKVDPNEPEAIRILRRVDSAAKAVQGIRYKATAKPSGIATEFVPEAEGEGIMYGWTGGNPEKFWAKVTVRPSGAEKPVELSGGGNGDMFFLVDHTTKKIYEDMDPNVLGGGGQAMDAIRMLEFVHPTPFSDEINAETVELQGTETIAGEECHKVHVTYAGGGGQSIWYFSKEDYLPRRRIRVFDDPRRGEGSVDITITELKVDPELKPEMFVLNAPQGYERVDDFAP